MSKYESYSREMLEEHLSNFLVGSWSYSAVSTFARNEKAFERTYIYCEEGRFAASSVAGNAYHEALAHFFLTIKTEGREPDLLELQQVAFEYIDGVDANKWQIQKTCPTVEDCIAKANKVVTSCLESFLREKDIYLEELDEVLTVEEKWTEWLTVNGVDIPLPCHFLIDVALRLTDGRVVVVDHKSKGQYTDDAEVALTHGKQGITYVLGFEKHTGIKVDEVWFMENKYSANKDGGPQIRKHAIVMDDDSRRLYEAMLYEPLRRMIQAVNDPDYIYTINDADNLSDKAELYAFWTRTMIAEVDDFPRIPEGRKELIAKRIRKVRDASVANVSPKVITSFRQKAAAFIPYDYTNSNMTNSEKIEHVLRTFGKPVQVYKEIDGFSSNTYLIQVSAGVRTGDIKKYALDIANALDVASVRIASDLEVYEGKSYLAIEVNKTRDRDLIWDKDLLTGRRIPIGVDNYGRTIVWDLDNHATPHVLDCGATGSGKSVLIRSTIAYAKAAGVDDIVILDPKNEFGDLAGDGTSVCSTIMEIEKSVADMVKEMEERVRYHLVGPIKMVVFDEFADAIAQSRKGKDLDVYEEHMVPTATGLKMLLAGIARDQVPKKAEKVKIRTDKSLAENFQMLLQKGRSAGFRVIAATQRASVNVMSGDTKVNFPVQICFRVPKATDSRVVLDEEGAETLTGKGDGLMKSPEYLDRLVRFQGFYHS